MVLIYLPVLNEGISGILSRDLCYCLSYLYSAGMMNMTIRLVTLHLKTTTTDQLRQASSQKQECLYYFATAKNYSSGRKDEHKKSRY
jgi:tryptophan synthase alpha subunit